MSSAFATKCDFAILALNMDGNLGDTVQKGARQERKRLSSVQAGQAIPDNWLYFSRSWNFENMKKTKITVLLVRKFYTKFRLRPFFDLWNERKKKVMSYIALGATA